MSNADKARNKRKVRAGVASVKLAKTRERILEFGRISLLPAYRAAGTLEKFGEGVKTDEHFIGLLVELNEQTKNVATGDLSRGEDMLVSQAHTLDAIFNRLAWSASQTQRIDQYEMFMKLALRAQNQARMAWESLAAIKNPPQVAFVHQANISAGPQQVNNGPISQPAPPAEEFETSPNQLLEVTNGQRLDTGATGAAECADPQLETVGAIHRTEDD